MACRDGDDRSSSETSCRIVYQECLRECHIATFARVQGYKCHEFRPGGERNSLETVWCSSCGCYIKHHRKAEYNYYLPPSPASTHVVAAQGALPLQQSPVINAHCHASASGCMAEEGMSRKKRRRRRLTEEQTQKVLDYAKRVNWSVKKQDDGKMLEFCEDIGISTEVCRNWINNHRKKIIGAS